MPADPFTFESASRHATCRVAFRAARPFLSWLLRAGTLRQLYLQLPGGSDRPFDELALDALGIRVDCDTKALARVPSQGPLIVTANHPHGALDGLALMALLRRVRPDVRLLANYLLEGIPELRSSCFFVDPFGGPAAAARSQAGLRAAHLWLRQGKALVIFPAGEVAPRRERGRPVDSTWRPTIGRLATQTGASILPANIAGANSWMFYAAGRVHPALRTALLAREFLKKRGQAVTVSLGEPRAPYDLPGAPLPCRAAAVTRAARSVVEKLGEAAAEELPGRIAAELAALEPDARLSATGAFDVYCAESRQIPAALQEIGRLRAVAYRAAGEGNGLDSDLDEFDGRYLHLFAWDRDTRRIVGAYRLGRTDRLVSREGVSALYTRTLFHYGPEFIARLTPALELGRSFVRPEYQRHPAALLALWKGIGAYVVRHPQYRLLFGPVSISARHSDASRHLLATFLEHNHLDSTLAQMVEPRHPRPRNPQAAGLAEIPTSIEAANRLVASMNRDGLGMPVLLRQYLKLHARLIGFNVDPSFGNVLDALMLVDLTAVDRAILARYLGQAGAASFLDYHSLACGPSAAA